MPLPPASSKLAPALLALLLRYALLEEKAHPAPPASSLHHPHAPPTIATTSQHACARKTRAATTFLILPPARAAGCAPATIRRYHALEASCSSAGADAHCRDGWQHAAAAWADARHLPSPDTRHLTSYAETRHLPSPLSRAACADTGHTGHGDTHPLPSPSSFDAYYSQDFAYATLRSLDAEVLRRSHTSMKP